MMAGKFTRLAVLALCLIAPIPAYAGMIGDASDILRDKISEEGGIEALIVKANEGNTEAMHALGGIYYFGVGVPIDYSEAAKWWSKGEALNDPDSTLSLATLYDEGLGVPYNDALASMLYYKAANMGQVEAQFALGYKSEFVGDYDEAVRWYRMAASMEHTNAQYNLARLYVKGQGVPQDFNEAMKLYYRAARGGHEKSQELLKKLGKSW